MRTVTAVILALATTPAAAGLETSCRPDTAGHEHLDCHADHAAAHRAGYRIVFEGETPDAALADAWRWLDRRAGRRVDAPLDAEALTIAGRRVTLAKISARGVYRFLGFDRAGRVVLDVRGLGLAVRGDRLVVVGERGYRPVR